jgi:hypothetical protein
MFMLAMPGPPLGSSIPRRGRLAKAIEAARRVGCVRIDAAAIPAMIWGEITP